MLSIKYETTVSDIGKLDQLHLPTLPRSIKYTDDFLDTSCILSTLENDTWELQCNGTKGNVIDFSKFNARLKKLLKCFCAAHILEHATRTSFSYFYNLFRLYDEHEICAFIFSNPLDIKILWEKSKLLKTTQDISYSSLISAQLCLKALLKYLCIHQFLSWSNSFISIISALQLTFSDRHASIKSGDCFLSVTQEAQLVSFFDKNAANPELLSIRELQNICLICSAYQHGMRPVQIGAVKCCDVKLIQQDDQAVSVHITFMKAKQRSESKAIPLVRKVKNEWAPLFLELIRRNQNNVDHSAGDHFFGVTSATETSQRISDTSELVFKDRKTPTDFRHTAAQRLVDAGASKEELAEFLGHSDLDTCLIYFDTSATQAERINKALGASETYSTLAKIAHSRMIDSDELLKLKGEQQIAGMPHGFAISGIGGCESGQPLCPFNPVTSCYGCPKFMPMNQTDVHTEVLHAMRSVVKQFVDAGLDDNKSPTFLQLKNVIANIESIIQEISVKVA